MNTGFFRNDKIYKDVGGVITQIYDFASQPLLTPAQLATATGMSLTRATELVAQRTTFNTTNCALSSVSNINFVSAIYSVVEPDSGVSVVNIVLRRTNGCDGSITVTVNRIGGTASAVNDFINIFPLTQTWLDGDCTDKTIQVSIVGDKINEPGVAETIILGLSNPIGNGIIGTLNQTTISITDNDLVYIVNTQISNTSNCLPTGLTTYPISANVLGGSNYNVLINLTGCTLTAILVNGVNVTPTELITAKLNGFHILTNVQSNITVELVYNTIVSPCNNFVITTETIPNGFRELPFSTQFNTSGGNGAITYDININNQGFTTGGVVSDNLTFTSSGLLIGNQNGMIPFPCGSRGAFNTIVRATDSTGCVATRSYSFVLNSQPLFLNYPQDYTFNFQLGVYGEYLIEVTPKLTGIFNVSLYLQNQSTNLIAPGLIKVDVDLYSMKLQGIPTVAGTYIVTAFWRDNVFGGCNNGETGFYNYYITVT
jgi:hypothetical protein